MTEPAVERADLSAAVGARRELGPDYEDAVLDSFLARIDAAVAARVDARVAERAGRPGAAGGTEDKDARSHGFVLGIISLGTGIPITAIASGNGGTSSLLVAWAGIAAVNLAHALGRRRSS
jgi:hypothetical protein